MASSLSTVESVTTQTFRAPKFFRSWPTSCVTPGPKRMDEAAISKAYSGRSPPAPAARPWRRLPDSATRGMRPGDAWVYWTAWSRPAARWAAWPGGDSGQSGTAARKGEECTLGTLRTAAAMAAGSGTSSMDARAYDEGRGKRRSGRLAVTRERAGRRASAYGKSARGRTCPAGTWVKGEQTPTCTSTVPRPCGRCSCAGTYGERVGGVVRNRQGEPRAGDSTSTTPATTSLSFGLCAFQETRRNYVNAYPRQKRLRSWLFAPKPHPVRPWQRPRRPPAVPSGRARRFVAVEFTYWLKGVKAGSQSRRDARPGIVSYPGLLALDPLLPPVRERQSYPPGPLPVTIPLADPRDMMPCR